jgi:hypothetical protein
LYITQQDANTNKDYTHTPYLEKQQYQKQRLSAISCIIHPLTTDKTQVNQITHMPHPHAVGRKKDYRIFS